MGPHLSFICEVLTRTWESGNTVVEAGQKAPKYFSEAGYRCPTDPRDGLMQYAYRTKLTTFEFMSSVPHILRDFNTFMGNTLGARKYWTDWFPVQERLLDGANEASPILVDVGGGKGHDVLDFQAKFPKNGRRLVLQDLSAVTSDLEDLGPGVERMIYDFFTQQPVQGKPMLLRLHQNFPMIEILKHHRCASLLLSPYTARLARLVLSEDLRPGQKGYDTRVLEAYYPRVGSSRAER